MVQSIKVVGVSGCGKTSLIKQFLEKNKRFCSMSYGMFIAQYGENADEQWEKSLALQKGIIIIDDHLEWGDRNLVSIYKEEGTLAILLITADPQKILNQRLSDHTRQRGLDVGIIEKEQEVSTQRASNIGDCLDIPIYKLHNASIEESVALLGRIAIEVG